MHALPVNYKKLLCHLNKEYITLPTSQEFVELATKTFLVDRRLPALEVRCYPVVSLLVLWVGSMVAWMRRCKWACLFC